jgi:putative transcriptional regulator
MIKMRTKITLYRKRLQITQEELAILVGVSRQTIIALEADRYNPSLRLAYDISRALGAKNVEEIFQF